jgi:hypothetical protein
MATQPPEQQSHPWSAVVQARLIRATGIDVVEEIDYMTGGQFTRRRHIVGGPDIGPIQLLDDQQQRQLLEELQGELVAPPSGVDAKALRIFADLLEDSLDSKT